jgi:hypothetical protein
MDNQRLEGLRHRFKETEKVTPADCRKVRNSCFSGHTAQEGLKCPSCRDARFRTLVSGYYGDNPTFSQVEAYLNRKNFNAQHLREDYLFVLEYLGLSEEGE